MYKILGSEWYTPPAPGLDAGSHAILGLPSIAIGVVAIASGDKWKCYLGLANGHNVSADEQSIAGNGVKVTKEVAVAHFPELPAGGFIA